MLHRAYEWAVRLAALAAALVICYVSGFHSLFLFCGGLILTSFLIIPLWRASAALITPPLVRSTEGLTRLDLSGR